MKDKIYIVAEVGQNVRECATSCAPRIAKCVKRDECMTHTASATPCRYATDIEIAAGKLRGLI